MLRSGLGVSAALTYPSLRHVPQPRSCGTGKSSLSSALYSAGLLILSQLGYVNYCVLRIIRW